MKKRALLLWVPLTLWSLGLFATSVVAFDLMSALLWLAASGLGPSGSVSKLILVFILVGFLGLVTQLILVFTSDRRGAGRHLRILGLAAGVLLAAPLVRHIINEASMANGTEIVRAILRYEEEHGTSPIALDDLVGTELDHLPQPWLLRSSWSYGRGGTSGFWVSYWVGGRQVYVIDRHLRWQFHDGG